MGSNAPLYPVIEVSNVQVIGENAATTAAQPSGQRLEASPAPKPDPSNRERLWKMGETARMRRHINGGASAVQDESITHKIESFCTGDFIVIIEALLCLPSIVFGLMIELFLTLPSLIVVRLYLACLPRPTHDVGTGLGFKMIAFVAASALLPALMVACFCLCFHLFIAYGVGFIYSTITCRWFRVFQGWRALAPYRNGPRLRFIEIVRAVIGAMHRQGFLEFYPRFCSMLIVVPFAKYVVATNALCYDVEEFFVTQRTTDGFSGDGVTGQELADTFNLLIARAVHVDINRSMIDKHPFAPHYPNPHHSTRLWHQGMQFHNNYSLLVHTTHAPKEERGLALSKASAHDGHLVTVMLWHSNPFHILTGYVEVNMTRDYGLEHPMWLAVGKGNFPFKMMWGVDDFFHKYAPDVAAFVRANNSEASKA